MKEEKLFINGRYLTQHLTGVNRFAYELTIKLIESGIDVTIICPKREIRPEYNIREFHIIKYGLGNSHFWEQISLPFFFAGRRNYLLVNFTGLGPIMTSNKIITIHDLAFLENPSWYSKSYVFLYKLLTPLCAKTSRHILSVSNFSKTEIIKWLGVESNHITVIYNAADENDLEQDDILEKVPSEYILAVSSIDPRKNFVRLIKAFSFIPKHTLVVVGGVNHVFNNVEIDTSLSNVIFLGRVFDAELTSLYKHATAFVYPSLYEGFGIPPIEAMTYGCPVIVSDIEVLHEVCGEAALYVDPYNEKQIALTISKIIGDENLRQDLIEKGYKNICRFNWKKSSLALMDVLKNHIDL